MISSMLTSRRSLAYLLAVDHTVVADLSVDYAPHGYAMQVAIDQAALHV